jgi:hypothetical protein
MKNLHYLPWGKPRKFESGCRSFVVRYLASRNILCYLIIEMDREKVEPFPIISD